MSQTEKPLYGRILLKLSGEALMGSRPTGSDPATIKEIAEQIHESPDGGAGCGSHRRRQHFPGVSGASQGMDRSTADYMGMLATVMNSLALQQALEQLGVPHGF